MLVTAFIIMCFYIIICLPLTTCITTIVVIIIEKWHNPCLQGAYKCPGRDKNVQTHNIWQKKDESQLCSFVNKAGSLFIARHFAGHSLWTGRTQFASSESPVYPGPRYRTAKVSCTRRWATRGDRHCVFLGGGCMWPGKTIHSRTF